MIKRQRPRGPAYKCLDYQKGKKRGTRKCSFEEGVTLSLESLKRMDTCSKTTKKGAGMGEKEKACKFLVIHSINYVNVPI